MVGACGDRSGRFCRVARRSLLVPLLLLGSACDNSKVSCVPPTVTTGGGSTFVGAVEVRQLGTATFSCVNSAPFVVDVATPSFMLVADGGRASDIDLAPIVNPLGATWVTAPFNDLDPIGRNSLQAAGQSVAAGLFPHTPTYTVPAGTYQFSVPSFGTAPTPVRVYAIFNPRQTFTAGTLNVNLHFCGFTDLSATSAAGNASFQTLWNEFRRILLQAGIQAQVAGTYDCPSADQTRLAVIESLDANDNGQADELEDLFALSGQTAAAGLSVFLVQEIDDGDGDITSFIAGIAGGIPGPGPIRGTIQSGVAVTVGDNAIGSLSNEQLVRRGRTMAHEVGHYLGLFHTTERCGADATVCEGVPVPNVAFNVDPLSDTPSCPKSADTDPVGPAGPDGNVDGDECLAFDGRNLMFWTQPSPPSVRDQISADQTFVVQRNPLVQ